MAQSIIRDYKKYMNLLTELLNDHNMISDPKKLRGLVDISVCKGKVMGWRIANKEITFKTDDLIDCDEAALLRGDRFFIKSFSYHFSPAKPGALLSYRIDLDYDGEVHLNPDESLADEYDAHLQADQLSLGIDDFNCLLAIYLALMYIKQCIYPADLQAGDYNRALDGIRRKLA